MFVKILCHLHPEIIKLAEGVKLLAGEGYGSKAEFHMRLYNLAAGGSKNTAASPLA
jgi:hypothetical protein